MVAHLPVVQARAAVDPVAACQQQHRQRVARVVAGRPPPRDELAHPTVEERLAAPEAPPGGERQVEVRPRHHEGAALLVVDDIREGLPENVGAVG